jgi:hypothetical protein
MRLDFGVNTPLSVESSRASFTWPGVDRLCSSRSGPKSLATYSSGSRSPSRSLAAAASVQPRETSSAKTPSTPV